MDTAPLSWTDWPARRRPARAGFAAAVVLIAVAGVAPTDPVLAVFGAALLLAATAEVLLPTRYTLDAEGVRLDGLLIHRVHSWSHFDGWRAAPDGFVLSGAGRFGFQRRRRTLRLRGAPAPDDVSARLASALPAPVGGPPRA